MAADRAPLIAAAGRIADDRSDLPNLGFDLVGLQRAILAALRLEADHVVAGRVGMQHIRRVALPLDVHAVAELPDEVLVPERDAVAHVVEDGLHQLAGALDVRLRRGQCFLALPQLGDVAEHREDAAVADRLEAELDLAAVLAPDISGAARRRQAGKGRRDVALHVRLAVDRTVVSAPRLKQHDVTDMNARLHQLQRQPARIDALAIHELLPHVLVDHRHAVAHVVERSLHDLTRALDVRLGRRQCLLALPQFGDVAEHRENAAVADRLETEFDVAAIFRPHVAGAARRRHAREGRFDFTFDIGLTGNRAIVAAPGLEQHQVTGRHARLHQFRRELPRLDTLLAHELQARILIEQRDAVAHVVERRLHHLAGTFDLGGALLHLVEQAQRFDGDHGLIGKRRDQLDLNGCEWPGFLAGHRQNADRHSLAHQWNAEHGAVFAEPLRTGPVVFGIGEDVGNVHDGPVKHGAAGQRMTARRHALA